MTVAMAGGNSRGKAPRKPRAPARPRRPALGNDPFERGAAVREPIAAATPAPTATPTATETPTTLGGLERRIGTAIEGLEGRIEELSARAGFGALESEAKVALAKLLPALRARLGIALALGLLFWIWAFRGLRNAELAGG